MSDRVEDHLRYALGLVNDWLRFGEAKSVALIALASGAVYATARLLATHDFGLAITLYAAVVLLEASVAVLFGLLSLLPQVNIGWLLPKGKASKKDNLYHYGEIAKYEPEGYLAKLCEALGEAPNDSKACLDLAAQVVVNSRIALRKYRCSAIAAWLMVFAVATPVFGFILWVAGDEG